MKNIQILDELDTLVTCQEVLAELVGEIPEGECQTKKLAILMGYLSDQQRKLSTQLYRHSHLSSVS